MKKLKIILGILLLLLLLSPFVYVKSNKLIYANRVEAYLIDEQKYREDEIKSIEGVWGIMLPSFYATVVFKNEPEVKYIYFAHNEVLQFDYMITEAGKEKGIAKSKLKHYVPLNE